jgi:hypothetical protein
VAVGPKSVTDLDFSTTILIKRRVDPADTQAFELTQILDNRAAAPMQRGGQIVIIHRETARLPNWGRRSRRSWPVGTILEDLSQREGPRFDMVTIYAEDPTDTVPTPPFPGSRDRVVRSVVLAVLPHFA